MKKVKKGSKTEREKYYCVALLFRQCLPFCFAEEKKPSNATFLSLCGEERKKARIRYCEGIIVVATYGAIYKYPKESERLLKMFVTRHHTWGQLHF